MADDANDHFHSEYVGEYHRHRNLEDETAEIRTRVDNLERDTAELGIRITRLEEAFAELLQEVRSLIARSKSIKDQGTVLD
jgi:phage shock protein A